jgi:thiosulfate reductase cytochrome b subunit
MTQRIYFFPLWLRIWHWMNAILILLLIISGISMEFSRQNTFLADFNLAVTIHNYCAIILTAGYIFYFFGNILTGNFRYYRLNYPTLIRDLFKQGRFYIYGIFKNEKHPFPANENRKFNPLQILSYVVIMYLFMPIMFLSGWMLLFPGSIPLLVLGVNGITFTVVVHLIVSFIVTLFLVVHVYMCTLGASFTSDFKEMITGWKEMEEA